jgi:hypothetical protein
MPLNRHDNWTGNDRAPKLVPQRLAKKLLYVIMPMQMSERS